jgi:hypothetical protein
MIMAWTYEDVTPTLIANTTIQKGLLNGVHKIYLITPIDGYVLHDNRLATDIDIEGNPIDPPTPGYTTATVTVAANYDFTANPNNIYAVLRNTVPEDQIFGGGNDHEIA